MAKLPYVSPDLLRSYQAEIAKRNTPATYKRKSASLKHFFDWASENGHVPQNPFQTAGQSSVVPVNEPSGEQNNGHKIVTFGNFLKLGVLSAMIVLIFLLLQKLKIPIPFIKTPASTQEITGITSPVYPTATPSSQQAVILSPWKVFTQLTLIDSSGNPAVGAQTVTFKIYKSQDDPTSLWNSDPQTITTDVNGNSLISLDGVPTDLFFKNDKLYLEANINGSPTSGSRIPISTANVAANLGGFFPSSPTKGAGPSTIPVLSEDGSLLLASQSPAVKAISGNLSIEGQAVLISTPNTASGNITVSPGGSGMAQFIFAGNVQNFLNAQAPNLTSGSLFYGLVANNATGYDLLRLQSGSSKTTRFSIDALGNTNLAGALSTSGIQRLTSIGSLTNIAGYSQNSGNFNINQGAGNTATINKNATALADLLTLSLDERNKANSDYSTLTLKRYNGSSNAYALLVDEGNARFNGQLQLGQYTSNPGAIGQGSLIFNTSDNKVYVWDGSNWTVVGASSSFSGSFGDLISGTNTAATMTVGTGAHLNYTNNGTINASSLEGSTWEAPGTIGSGTPNTGAFTNLTSSGNSTIGTGPSSINTIGSTTTPGTLTLHGATTLDNTFTVSGNNPTTLGGNLAVNGPTSADITSTTTTASLFNSTVATLNIGGAATTINIGPTGSGASSIVLSGGSGDTGCTLDGSNGNLACTGTISGSGITATSIPFSGITNGTNIQAAMIVGSGASLTYIGGVATNATINANQLLGGTWAVPGTIGLGTPNSGAFTTLTSSGNSTIGTGTSTTNTFGDGASSINTIGSVTTPGALTLHGTTTLDNTFTVSGSNLTSLGGNLTVTGTTWTATPTISGLITATSGLTSNGTVTVQNNSNLTQTGSGTFGTGTGAVSLNGDTTIAANKNLTFTSGTGIITQNYSSTTGNEATFNHTNSGSSGTNVSKVLSLVITGTDNPSGTNTVTGIDFPNVTAHTYNTYYGLNFGTGLTDILRYNGTQIISGTTGVLQSAGLSGTYSNALTLSNASNSITAGTLTATGGTINGTTIGQTTPALITGTTVNATDALQTGGTIEALRSYSVPQRFYISSVNDANVPVLYVDGNGQITMNSQGAQAIRLNYDKGTGGTIFGTGAGGTAASIASNGDFTTIGDAAINGGDITSTGALNVNSATVNAITLDSGTTGAVNIGTNANSKIITMGNTSTNTNVVLTKGVSGNVTLTGFNCSTYTNNGKLTTNSSGNIICGNDVGGAGSSVAWSDIITPTNNLTLSHSAYTTTMNWTATGDLSAWTMNLTNNAGSSTNQYLMTLNNAVSSQTTDINTEALLLLDNKDTSDTGSTIVDNAILITNSGGIASGITDAIDASAPDIVNAINVGPNIILGTTATIDFSNFDVATTGNITVATGVGLDTNTGAGTLALGNVNATTLNVGSSNTATTINLGNGTGGNTISIGNGVNTVAQTINIANGASGANSTVNILGGVATTGTQALNLGTGASAKTITIGNITGTSGILEKVGTGNYSLDGAATSTYAIGASTTTGTITIGGTAQTGDLTLGSSSGTNTIYLGNGTGATTVNISNANTAGAVNIGAAMTSGTITIGGIGLQTGTISIGTGTGAQALNFGTGGTGAKTVTVGSTADTSSLALDSGTGAINIGTSITKTITLGNVTGATAVNVNTGTAGTTYTTTNGIFTLNTGTGNISLGTDAVAKTVSIGNTTGASATSLNAGLGNLTLNATSGNLALSTTTSGNITLSPGGTGDINVTTDTDSFLNIAGLTSGTGSVLCVDGSNNVVTCASGGGILWNQIGNPNGNQSLTMGTYTTTWNWATGTGASNLFSLTTDNSSNGTGYLMNLSTGTSSTVKPFTVSAQGNTIIDTTATGNLSLGYASGTFALTSSGGLNVTTGGVLTGVASLDTISTSATALTFAGAGTINTTTTGILTLDSGTTGAINIGTNANAKTITLGNVTGATAVNVNTGTAGTTYTTTNGIFTLNTGTGNISLGTDAVAKTVSIGNTTGASATSLNAGSGNLTLNATSGNLALSTTTSGNITLAPGGVGDINVTTDADSFLNIAGLTSSAGSVLCVDASNNVVTCSAGGGVLWNQIGNPNGNQTLTMGLYTTTWNWNSLTSGTGLTASSTSLSSGTLASLSVSGTAAASNTQKVLSISTAGANATDAQTTYGLYLTNTHTTSASTNTNVGGYFSASGGTNNYGLLVANGNVGIGNTSPGVSLSVGSNSTSHSLGTSDALISGKLEVDNTLYLDSATTIANSLGTTTVALSLTPTTTANQLTGASYLIQNATNLGMAALMVDQTMGGDIFSASVSGTPKFVIDHSGNVGIGTTTPSVPLTIAGSTAQIVQIRGDDTTTAIFHSVKKSRGSVTSPTIVQSGDGIFNLSMQGYDGASYIPLANIKADVDATPGTNDMPGRLSFWTTPYGSAATVERMRIDNAGNVGIGTTGPTGLLQITQPTTGPGTIGFTGTTVTGSGTQFTNTFKVGNTITSLAETHTISAITSNTSMTTDSWTNACGGGCTYTLTGGDRLTVLGNGNVGIGNISPASKLDVDPTGTFSGGGVAGIKVDNATVTLSGANPTTYVNFRENLLGIMTLEGTNANQTVTTASTLFVQTPVAGTNVTITNIKPIDTATGGYLSSTGTWTNGPSYRRYKDNFTSTSGYLDKLANLDLYEWQYKNEVVDGANRYQYDQNRHASPFLDDFYTVFGLGDNLGVNVQDLAGVALASVKELNTRFENFKNAETAQELAITDTGDLNITKNSNGNYQLTNTSNNSMIDKIGAFAELIAANIKVGAIESSDFTTQNLYAFQGTVDNLLVKSGLVSPSIKTALISPLPDGKDVTIQIGKGQEVNGETSTEPGKLAIQNKQGTEVAAIDEGGNATFSGTLNSTNLNTGNATISGVLVADKIQSTTLDDIQKLLKQVETDQNLLSQASNWNVNTASEAGTINNQQLTINDLFVTGTAAFSSLSLSQSLTLGTDLVISSSVNQSTSLPINNINTLSAPLSLQSLAMAPVEIMAGKFKIATNGDVEISGNLNVAGKIESEGLTLKPDQSGFGDLLTLKNATGSAVANINTSGSAQFNEVQTQGLTIASPNNPSTQSSDHSTINTNATIGTAVIPAGTADITINNSTISDNTLIYLTATSTTKNNVLYVKEKGSGYFKAGFTDPLDVDVSFNWWIVETK